MRGTPLCVRSLIIYVEEQFHLFQHVSTSDEPDSLRARYNGGVDELDAEDPSSFHVLVEQFERSINLGLDANRQCGPIRCHVSGPICFL